MFYGSSPNIIFLASLGIQACLALQCILLILLSCWKIEKDKII